jgi:hypothetical protein
LQTLGHKQEVENLEHCLTRSFTIYTLHQINRCDQMKTEMDRACRVHGEMTNAYTILKEKDY